ncbi:MAG: biotin--[acetyl-CoA-carboxylase] ligase [Algibacter sp.]|uniref:biotin--[acetyl-CoA-carboxylase] ligase n=1 Tax=Algibacter sp. TaxID=1872428 RepID=UPI0026266255|nr:biotin--[acetyl-CoA-carboxylase] ligase [Algibacter sp.]MDG1731214.1 biotin--[acetyl-CoA-carboxylase] ligase [Algibacter sp.]MDG1731233.1 biotin--[acetyl-CoA-carboxylase] ligase [Algibacter sp.]MDG2178086.1 biotin--[acetyl-CoA-carboxylase] ligase [Algibacter sp.]
MRIIKLNATDSTNSYLKKLCATESVDDYTAVIAENQTQGRGQMGASWNSEVSKNLTVSVFKELSGFNFEVPFYISIVVTLSILKVLKALSIPRLSIKWPNDILSADKKICGILIETVIKQNSINASVIGIGLNVNQITFDNLPKASSLKLISGKEYKLDELIISILDNLKPYFLLLKDEKYDVLKDEYEALLFRKNKPSTFINAEGAMFSGFIKGVSDSGHLQVLLEDRILKVFNLKEIKLLY